MTLAELGRTIERHGVDVRKLEQGHVLLAASVAELARTLDKAAKASGAGLRPHVSWLQPPDPDRAVAGLVELHSWVERVYLQWPDATLPSCWKWHPWLVEELWVLWAAHIAAWHPDSGDTGLVGDWHERRRPGTVKRLAAISGCRLRHHKETGALDTAPTGTPLAGSSERIAASWTTYGYQHQQPYPTPAELQEADEFEARAVDRT